MLVCGRLVQVDGMLDIPLPSYFGRSYQEQNELVAIRGR